MDPCTIAGLGEYYPMKWDNKKRKLVRLCNYLYEQKYGPIPQGLVLRHLCHDKACINLSHLAVGTRRENAHDSSTNPLGIPGIHRANGRYYAKHYTAHEGKIVVIYSGPDFFEACCALRSYEARLK